MYLRDRSKLPQVLRLGLESVPQSHALQQQLMHQKPPSAASICRSQILVDAATRTYFAQTFATFDGVLYLWADSSPQGHVDWLLSLLRAIPFSSLRSPDFGNFSHGIPKMPPGSGPCRLEIAEERHKLGECLQKHTQLHRQIPIALGSGETSLERKLIAMCRKVYAECQSMQATQNYLSKVWGFCTDLGTESGLADADGCQLADVLPAWFHDSGLESEAAVSAPQRAPAPNSSQAMHHGYVFPNSLPSPGLLHVSHNMCADIYRSFATWASGIESFKALAELFYRPELRKRLIGTCLLGTPWEFMKSRLETGLEKPALWRWSTIQRILPKLLGFKRLLQTIWDPHKFGQQPDAQAREEAAAAAEGDRNSDPAEYVDLTNLRPITESIRSEAFWQYSNTVCKLSQFSEDLV